MKLTGFLLLLTLSGGMVGQPELSQAQTQVIADLVEAKGKVELNHNQTGYKAVPSGTTLKFGDLLRVSPGSRAVIRCRSNPAATWTIPDDGVPRGVANYCS